MAERVGGRGRGRVSLTNAPVRSRRKGSGRARGREGAPLTFSDDYLEYIRLFNEGRYHESYEALQEAWRINPSNRFYKGLIQLAGALDHWQNESYYWAESLFRSSAELLRPYAPRYGGLDLEKLIPLVETCADVAAQQRKDRSTTYRLPPLVLEIKADD